MSIGSLLFDNDSGELVGVGIYLRVPSPWEDYLEVWKEKEDDN